MRGAAERMLLNLWPNWLVAGARNHLNLEFSGLPLEETLVAKKSLTSLRGMESYNIDSCASDLDPSRPISNQGSCAATAS